VYWKRNIGGSLFFNIVALLLCQDQPYPVQIVEWTPFLLTLGPTLLILIVITEGYKGVVITSLLAPLTPPELFSYESVQTANVNVLLNEEIQAIKMKQFYQATGDGNINILFQGARVHSKFVNDLCSYGFIFGGATLKQKLNLILHLPNYDPKKFSLIVDTRRQTYRIEDECLNPNRSVRGATPSFLLKHLDFDYGTIGPIKKFMECSGSVLATAPDHRHSLAADVSP